MKKDLSILWVVVLALSIFLAACATPPIIPPTAIPTAHPKVNPRLILGTWIDDATGVEWIYAEDGSLSSTSRVIAKYVFDGYQLTTTNWDGQVVKPTVIIMNDKMVETAGDGTVTHFTKKK